MRLYKQAATRNALHRSSSRADPGTTNRGNIRLSLSSSNSTGQQQRHKRGEAQSVACFTCSVISVIIPGLRQTSVLPSTYAGIKQLDRLRCFSRRSAPLSLTNTHRICQIYAALGVFFDILPGMQTFTTVSVSPCFQSIKQGQQIDRPRSRYIWRIQQYLMKGRVSDSGLNRSTFL